MVGTERARRDEDVGVGFTSIGVTDKKLGGVFCQGPICNENICKQGLDRKAESALEGNTFSGSESVCLAEEEGNTLSCVENVF